MLPAHAEYKIRPGDKLTHIIRNIYGWTPHNQPATYHATLKGILTLNPHIKDPDRITAGQIPALAREPDFSDPAPGAPHRPAAARLRQ